MKFFSAMFALVLIAGFVPTTSASAWDAPPGWHIASESSLDVSAQDATTAWRSDLTLDRSWSVVADISLHRNHALIGHSKLLFGDAGGKPLLAVDLQSRGGQLTLMEVVLADPSPSVLIRSGWMPGNDARFILRIGQSGGVLRIQAS